MNCVTHMNGEVLHYAGNNRMFERSTAHSWHIEHGCGKRIGKITVEKRFFSFTQITIESVPPFPLNKNRIGRNLVRCSPNTVVFGRQKS